MKVYYHRMRGTYYRIAGEGHHNSSAMPEIDRLPIVVYYNILTREISTRFHDEFYDGRFIEMSPTEAMMTATVARALSNALEGGYDPRSSDPEQEARQLYDFDEASQLIADRFSGDASPEPWVALEEPVRLWQLRHPV